MIRYDKTEVQKLESDKSDKPDHVSIDKEHMTKIKDIFLNQLRALEINGVKVINNITNDMIIFNPKVTSKMIFDNLGAPEETKLDFVKDMYMYRLDAYTDLAYGRPVTAIQEFPYSFQEGQTPDIIIYEFIS